MHPRLSALRLVAITEEPTAAPIDGQAVGALARSAPPGGLLIQVRAKALDGGALAELTRAVMAWARPHGALVLVNDRLDVALACGADGVHLPEQGLEVAEARALAAGRSLLIGASRHDAAAAIAAAIAGADLVHLGPIWATPSKRGLGEPLGREALTAARHGIGERAALVAVGGIDAARAALARTAGAHAVAAIRAAWCGDGAALLGAP
jgi:thiamine-phosphate pyrophosphorylase